MKNLLPAMLGITLIWLLPQQVFSQQLPAYALTDVTIHHADGSSVSSGTIVWRDGVIRAAGSNIAIPFDAFEISGGDTLHVYPGFIDGLGHWGVPDRPRSHERAADPGNPGYSRAGIQPERSARDHLIKDSADFENAAKQGVITAAIGLKGYMMPGKADLFFLNKAETPDHLYRESTGLLFQFEGAPGGWTNRAYPGTTMGIMARFRQLMYDAEALMDHMNYYASAEGIRAPARDEVLESLFPLKDSQLPVYAILDEPEDLERLTILQDEFGFNIVVVSGKEMSYRTDLLRERDIPVLASFELPEKPKWMTDEDDEGPASAEEESYRERQQQAYENIAHNIRRLLDAGVSTGFASAGMENNDLLKKLRALQEDGGLTESEILSLLTVNTADILGIGRRVGKLEPGYSAGFSVFTKPLFDEETSVKMVISNGVIHEF